MSSTNIEQVMPVKLAQALANPLFPALDSALRSGRHIGLDELDNHAFLMDFQEYLEEFYARYNVELIRAPEGFFYLRPQMCIRDRQKGLRQAITDFANWQQATRVTLGCCPQGLFTDCRTGWEIDPVA